MTPAELLATRKSLGLLQRELAELLAVNERTVRRWESGAKAMTRRDNLAVTALRDLARERTAAPPPPPPPPAAAAED